MEKELEILKQNRKNILKIIEGLSLAQMNTIPKGFNNNIVWNIAHLIVTHQLLCYDLCNLPIKVTSEMIHDFRKGTKPNREISSKEFDIIKEQLTSLIDIFEEDLAQNIFEEYKTYTTSANVTLNSIEDAISFNNFHEGIHLGTLFTLKKLV